MNNLKLDKCDTLNNYFSFVVAEVPTLHHYLYVAVVFKNIFGTHDCFWAFGQMVIGNI